MYMALYSRGVELTQKLANTNLTSFSLLPLMFVSYLLQYLDKTAMSYTSILGLLPGTVR